MESNQKLVIALAITFLSQTWACGTGEVSEKSTDSVADSMAGPPAPLEPIEDIHVCTELYPDEEPGYVNLNYTSNMVKTMSDGRVLDSSRDHLSNQEAVEIAGDLSWRWDKRMLKVKFIGGDPVVREKVKAVAKRWEEVCGVRWLFGDTTDPDITVSFAPGGSWSYIGSYSRRKTPSMNFGWLKPDSDQEEYNRVVLHEFGHALGFIHEHQQPNANLPWNKTVVYDYYRRSQRPPWGKEKVDHNIFKKYTFEQVNGTEYDSLSIMLYSFPARFMLHGPGTPWNTRLSNRDITFAGEWFPPN